MCPTMAVGRLSGLTLFIIVLKVVVLITAAVPWSSQADHYWNMDRLSHSQYAYDDGHDGTRWNAYIRGGSEVVISPSNVGISLYGTNAWVDLGSHNNSCLVDVVYCSNGLSATFWVKPYQSAISQVLVVFGGLTRGLRVTKTNDDEIEIQVTSDEMGKTWQVRSMRKQFKAGAWHHVGITWNSTEGLRLYLNGTRTENIKCTISFNHSLPNDESWLMYLARSPDGHPNTKMAVDELALWSRVINSSTIQEAFQYKTGIPSSSAGCSSSWTPHLQHCYRQFNVLKPWKVADEWCQAYSSSMVSIVSENEKRFMNSITNNNSSHCTYLARNKGSDRSVLEIFGLERNDSIQQQQQCIYKHSEGVFQTGNCDKKCTFLCKQERVGLFKNAAFSCGAKLFDRGISGHRVSITMVPNEVECAIECLLYGSGCQSYNYQVYTTGSPNGGHICELNRSRDHAHLVPLDGYQYCERE